MFFIPVLFACSNKTSISENEAIEIAMKDAGVKASEVSITEQKFDQEDNEYSFKFQSDKIVYKYDINANSGKILEKEKHQRTSKEANNNDVNTSATTQNINEDQWEYVQIAADHFSIKKDDISQVKVENDTHNGVDTYDVKFYVGTKEYQCEIQKDNKQILESKIDQD